MNPIIHFFDPELGEEISPCGDVDDDSVVSHKLEEVTCQMCLHAMRSNTAKTKPTYH